MITSSGLFFKLRKATEGMIEPVFTEYSMNNTAGLLQLSPGCRRGGGDTYLS